MKKIYILLMLLLALLQQNTAVAQSKEKAEKAFLKELNMILKNSHSQHWSDNITTIKIDTPFAISSQGIFSVSVRFTINDDSTFVRARMEAPLSKIINVAYDLYLILEYKAEEVTIYKSELGSEELKEIGKSVYFHIGDPMGDGSKEQEKLQRLLDKLLKYYTK